MKIRVKFGFLRGKSLLYDKQNQTYNLLDSKARGEFFTATSEIFMRGFYKNLKAKSMLNFKIQRTSRGLSKTSLALL